MTVGEPSQRTSLLLAMEVVRAAYEEGLLKHGMLPSTVAAIRSYAEGNRRTGRGARGTH
ncbi:hypothetical protein GCM10010411_44750 [Actinomadura fulvescens]|uniref:Uncharacterized protein n=1 Tax=Actinomadura fulvescens TaxID=46160 RepID=A0ABP6C8F5_9ACTN